MLTVRMKIITSNIKTEVIDEVTYALADKGLTAVHLKNQ
jgi:hypothetical protein